MTVTQPDRVPRVGEHTLGKHERCLAFITIDAVLLLGVSHRKGWADVGELEIRSQILSDLNLIWADTHNFQELTKIYLITISQIQVFELKHTRLLYLLRS